jgi:predicted nucleotidyltransferase
MDTERLLRSLSDHDVEYVVIGSRAFPVHGYARATLDIDIFIRPTLENAERVRGALAAVGYDVTDATAEEFCRLKILFRQYLLAVDTHPHVAGADFDGVWARRVMGHVGTVTVPFASLDDLIAMKRAAGRPKDLEDLRYLEAIRERNSGQP